MTRPRPEPPRLIRYTLKGGERTYRWARPVRDDMGHILRWDLVHR